MKYKLQVEARLLTVAFATIDEARKAYPNIPFDAFDTVLKHAGVYTLGPYTVRRVLFVPDATFEEYRK